MFKTMRFILDDVYTRGQNIKTIAERRAGLRNYSHVGWRLHGYGRILWSTCSKAVS